MGVHREVGCFERPPSKKSISGRVWGGPAGGGPKFRAGFLLPPKIPIMCSLSGPSRGILVVFEAQGPPQMHVWSLYEPRNEKILLVWEFVI